MAAMRPENEDAKFKRSSLVGLRCEKHNEAGMIGCKVCDQLPGSLLSESVEKINRSSKDPSSMGQNVTDSFGRYYHLIIFKVYYDSISFLTHLNKYKS